MQHPRDLGAQLVQGKPVPLRRIKQIYLPSPPFVKVIALRRYAAEYQLTVFVETGTAAAQTTAGVADLFARCTTIELSEELHSKAVARLASMPHITCVHGDSGAELKNVLTTVDVPALFWLDAHASGGTTADAGYDPIERELEAIYAHPVSGHVIRIDDARGHQVASIISRIPPNYRASVHNDIIRIVPASTRR